MLTLMQMQGMGPILILCITIDIMLNLDNYVNSQCESSRDKHKIAGFIPIVCSKKIDNVWPAAVRWEVNTYPEVGINCETLKA